jgi:L-2-hydroxyglutarate oxidase
MMSDDIYDLVVVGAGIVGISTAYEYQNRFPQKKILIIEKESKVSTHQTKRNSGVIHSGIIIKPNSFKSKKLSTWLSIIIEFAKKNKINHQITGKLIVAIRENQIDSLIRLFEYGQSNGIKGIRLIDY